MRQCSSHIAALPQTAVNYHARTLSYMTALPAHCCSYRLNIAACTITAHYAALPHTAVRLHCCRLPHCRILPHCRTLPLAMCTPHTAGLPVTHCHIVVHCLTAAHHHMGCRVHYYQLCRTIAHYCTCCTVIPDTAAQTAAAHWAAVMAYSYTVACTAVDCCTAPHCRTLPHCHKLLHCRTLTLCRTAAQGCVHRHPPESSSYVW